MKMLVDLGKRFLFDDKAAEVTELGIVLALNVAGAVLTISAIGGKVQNAYNNTNAKLP